MLKIHLKSKRFSWIQNPKLQPFFRNLLENGQDSEKVTLKMLCEKIFTSLKRDELKDTVFRTRHLLQLFSDSKRFRLSFLFLGENNSTPRSLSLKGSRTTGFFECNSRPQKSVEFDVDDGIFSEDERVVLTNWKKIYASTEAYKLSPERTKSHPVFLGRWVETQK